MMPPIRTEIVVLALACAVTLGCGATRTDPVKIAGCPSMAVVGEGLSLSAITGDGSLSSQRLSWIVKANEKEVARGIGNPFKLTPDSSGDYTVEVLASADGSLLDKVHVVVETSQQRDARMTKAFTGLWRFQDGDETTVIRLLPNGKLTAHAHVNAGGAADAVLSAAQHDMGDIKGEWWVESGDFCIRFTGVENSIWNIWVRAVDAVFVGNFGKLLRYKVTLGEDKIILEPRSADQEVIELRHVQSEK